MQQHKSYFKQLWVYLDRENLTNLCLKVIIQKRISKVMTTKAINNFKCL